MVGISNKEAPLRLLALGMVHKKTSTITDFNLTPVDGGGVTTVSELTILKEVMLQIQRFNHLPSIPKPCEVFDMMGGSGTGGLFAVMLGRLQMTIDGALYEYRSLAKTVFSDTKTAPCDGAFRATTLEKAVQSIVHKYGGTGNPKMTLLEPEHESACKV